MRVCQHPNLVKILDVYETLDQTSIVLEYLEGKDLFHYLKERGKLPESRVKEIIYYVLSGLKELN